MRNLQEALETGGDARTDAVPALRAITGRLSSVLAVAAGEASADPSVLGPMLKVVPLA